MEVMSSSTCSHILRIPSKELLVKGGDQKYDPTRLDQEIIQFFSACNSKDDFEASIGATKELDYPSNREICRLLHYNLSFQRQRLLM